MTSLTPVPLDGARVGPAASMLAAAFAEDPLFGWFFPDPAGRPVLSRLWMRTSAVAAVDCGRALSIEVERRPVGVALWGLPGVELLGRDRFAPLWHLLVGANPHRTDDLRHGLALLAAAHEGHPDHFYLNTIGIDASRRGRGEGRRLIEPVLEEADRSDLGTYLESSNPRNVSFYRRLGFEVTDEIVLPGPGPGPVIRPMWRAPQS